MSKALDFANANLGDGEFTSFKLPQGSDNGEAGAIRVDNAGKIEYWSTGSYTDMWREMDEGDLLATMRILLVGGGGGGGTAEQNYAGAGGGGAGGLIHQTAYNFPVDTAISFTVGTGAAMRSGNRLQGLDGNDTTFHTLTAVGGGGGGAAQRGDATSNGRDGGSGGGNGYDGTSNTGGQPTAGQGNAGGAETQYFSASGGGGAGAEGGVATGHHSTAGHGGDGVSIDITGTSVFYAGGGGAGSYTGTGGNGGQGGGGHGGNLGANNQASRDGDDGYGGGGGGASGYSSYSKTDGGAGGDGIIILRLDTTLWSAAFSGTHTKTSSTIGNDIIYSITAANNASVTISAV